MSAAKRDVLDSNPKQRSKAMRKKMTKRQVEKMFREEIAPLVREQYGRGDVIAMRNAWADYTDMLAKDGEISAHQYETWENPF